MLVCTQGAAVEMDWWWFGVLHVLQYYTHFSSAPACTACTDKVNAKALELDVTTTTMAKAILRLKTLTFIPSYNMIGSIFFYVRRTNLGLPCTYHLKNALVLS